MKEASHDVPLNNKINTAKDVAKSICWLASNDASFVTGEILTIDGGQSLTSNNYHDYLKELEAHVSGGGIMGNVFGGGK